MKYLPLVIFALTAHYMVAPAMSAPKSVLAPGAQKISMVADESQITPEFVLYTTAHMTTQTGSTLDADQLKAYVGAGNTLKHAVATGNVKAFVDDPTNKRKYNVTSDSAVFDPKTNTIDLEGNVKCSVTSALTDGPWIQTGTSATIQLGTGPDYPIFIMHQIQANFTLNQESNAATSTKSP
jgi:lipopolysaccharide export system protein LptA